MDKPAEDKVDTKEKESSLKQNFNDNYAQSEEGEEDIEIQNIPIKDYAVQKGEDTENDKKLIQNLSMKNYVAPLEKERKVENSNEFNKKFESGDEKEEKRNIDKSNEDKEKDKKSPITQKFLINENNVLSNEGNEVKNDNNLIQNLQIKNDVVQSEKEEKVEKNTHVFFDEERNNIKNDEPKKTNDNSIYEQVNSLLKRKKSKKTKKHVYQINLLHFS